MQTAVFFIRFCPNYCHFYVLKNVFSLVHCWWFVCIGSWYWIWRRTGRVSSVVKPFIFICCCSIWSSEKQSWIWLPMSSAGKVWRRTSSWSEITIILRVPCRHHKLKLHRICICVCLLKFLNGRYPVRILSEFSVIATCFPWWQMPPYFIFVRNFYVVM